MSDPSNEDPPEAPKSIHCLLNGGPVIYLPDEEDPSEEPYLRYPLNAGRFPLVIPTYTANILE